MSCPTQSSCAPGTLNALYDLTGRKSGSGGILDEFDLSVETCAQAMSIFGNRLKKRLCASGVVVFASSATNYSIELSVGRKEAVVNLQLASGCNYPVTADYTKGMDSGSATFRSLDELLNWLVKHLRI